MRVRVAGLYVENNKLLLVVHKKDDQKYFLLPGGGVDKNEGLIEALKREWLEELSINIEASKLLFVGESISIGNKHVIQIVFLIQKIADRKSVV